MFFSLFSTKRTKLWVMTQFKKYKYVFILKKVSCLFRHDVFWSNWKRLQSIAIKIKINMYVFLTKKEY